jgi:hypothetical protein
MKNKRIITAFIAITILLLSNILVFSQTGKRERIRFKRGSTSAKVSGAVVRGTRDTYIIGARKGQTMTVSITSVEDNASFTISYAGGQEALQDATDVKRWSGELTDDNDYEIEVGPTRGNATYSLIVKIK